MDQVLQDKFSLLTILIPLLPLLGFGISAFLGKHLKGITAGVIATLAVAVSFAFSCFLYMQSLETGFSGFTVTIFDWISAGSLSLPLAFQVDQLSLLFMLIITGVGSLIHLYSIGYMHDDEGFPRFFSYLNLFIFFMLLLVMGSNYLVLFIGWEGVGLCSYLLIGYWFKNPSYNDAAKKAFVMNRIGDLGFLLGIFLIFMQFGSLTFSEVFAAAGSMPANDSMLVAITLLLFVGAVGKSAQIPLFTWLPDAMAGPTPVSALIHAATMVTAGIYLVVRSNVLYSLAPDTQQVIMVIGLATAIFAATIGLRQNDIKKVLAYSTVSQLGFMFLALGLGAYTAAFFHVMTHAFFKALLFLGAGSVIHAMGGEQDIRRMGGLWRAIPFTFWTFLIGTVAIAGIPPFAGFFSKDEILAHAFAESPLIWGLAVIGSMLTAFYMFRLLFLTFSGQFRGTTHQQEHLHESPLTMTLPLVVLAVFSIIAGFAGVPEVLGGGHWLQSYLLPVVPAVHMHLDHATEYALMASSVILVLIMIGFAWFTYVRKKVVPSETEPRGLAGLIANKYYIDEIYEAVIEKPVMAFSAGLHKFVEVGIIDRIVDLFGWITVQLSRVLRYSQTGSVGFYFFAMTIGILVIILINAIN